MLRVLLYAVVLFNSLSALRAEFSSSADDAFIRDDSNRVRFFHGVNMVHKSFPWYSDVLLDTDNIKDLQKWGLNALRLGVMWTGTEPNKGEYNETYLDIVTGIIDNLQSHGVHVLIDVHQDVLSSYFCEYDGAPTWLVDMSTSSEHEFPWPLPGTCSDRPWGSNYLAEATGAAFQDIYDNNNGMMDHFAAFWRKVADTFKGKDLLGYEIINEPWAGNIYSNPSLLLPGVAGSINLQPMYDTISSAIRSVDEAHLIFYEPVTWGMIFNGTVSGSGFSHVPGGDTYTRKSVLSFHYYCWWYDSTGAFDRVTCDAMFGPKVFDQCREDVSQLGGSYMLTEWGQGCDPTTPEGSLECNAVMDLADSHLTSWIDWYWGEHLEGSGFDATDEAVAVFSRTYAQVDAVCCYDNE